MGVRVPPFAPADILLAIALAAVASIASCNGAALVSTPGPLPDDIWFDADVMRTWTTITTRQLNQHQTDRHPLFPLAANVPVTLVRKAAGVSAVTAVRTVHSLVAAAWIIALFALLRLLDLTRVDAVLFALLAGASANAMFWFVVPETWPFGSLTILCAVLIAAAGARHRLSPGWDLASGVLTLSITVTNWMVSLFATLVRCSRRQLAGVAVGALVIVCAAWAVQKVIYPTSRWFLTPSSIQTRFFLNANPAEVVRAFFVHSVVMPELEVIEKGPRKTRIISVQSSPLGSATTWGLLATLIWLGVLGVGLFGLATDRASGGVREVLGLSLLGQLALHLAYGSETFLYSLHFGPLLVILAAFGTKTPVRAGVRLLVAALIVLAAANNLAQLENAAALAARLGTR